MFCRSTAAAIFKALLLYLAGKAMRKYIPSSTVLLWLFIAAKMHVGVLVFIAAYIAIPYLAAAFVRAIWGQYEITYPE